MIFKASPLHELVDKKAVIIFNAKTNQPNEIQMMKLPKKRDLRLKQK